MFSYHMMNRCDLTATPRQLFTSITDSEYGCNNNVVYQLRSMGLSEHLIEWYQTGNPDRKLILLRNKRRFFCLWWRKSIEKAIKEDAWWAAESKRRYLYD